MAMAGGVDPAPADPIAEPERESFGIRPGPAVDDPRKHPAADLEQSDHEHPIVGRAVDWIDDQRATQLTVASLPDLECIAASPPVVISARGSGPETRRCIALTRY